jgi:2-polyprenyl-3-methyl-5-hydroxy-6-metoxy-1,4-benzoquinol methylase
MKCRFDGSVLKNVFLDLGHCPPSNSYLTDEMLQLPEATYPLKVFVSDSIFYVQVPEYKKAIEIFNEDYAYFSSVSKSWLQHCEKYVGDVTKRFNLSDKSFVVEVASNDGYLLQYFKERKIPCLGVEPSKSVASVAMAKGIDTEVSFFTERKASELKSAKGNADLILGNNVFAHVPDIRDFIKGLKVLLNPKGVITLEFPHLLKLISENQFDTIYHEHYSYFSLMTVNRMVSQLGLKVFDVEELKTHGGSLRIFMAHSDDASKETTANVKKVLNDENLAGLDRMQTYLNFTQNCEKLKIDFLRFLLDAKLKNKTVAAYGAAAKGNTLMNYCGIKNDLIQFVCDRAPSKIGKFMPGSHVPIKSEESLKQSKPDYIVIFPWNIKSEIVDQLSYVRSWNAQFVTAVPKLEVF